MVAGTVLACGSPIGFGLSTDTLWQDPSPHQRSMISVDQDVQLEVLDWGGSGRPLVFISGLGNTAHIWDNFAQKFIGNHHVYAITRRGFGRSTHPPDGFSAARLADDVLSVMNQLHIDKPVLVGHSLGGEELSSIGTHHPDRVSGLIYLDAAYTYAFFDTAGDYTMSLADVQQKLSALSAKPNELERMGLARDSVKQFQENLERKINAKKNPLPPPMGPPSEEDKASFVAMLQRMKRATGGTPPESEIHESFQAEQNGSVGPPNASADAPRRIFEVPEHFTAPIHLPILAIMGYPQSKGPDFSPDTPQKTAAASAADANQARQIDAFEKGQPTARVVRIPNANHYIFISNEAQVFTTMSAFLAAIPD
jgi:pimeloyl-ACP methyl ester carboxylesterase